MADLTTDLTTMERRLSALLDELRDSESEQLWLEVEHVSQALANGLRSRDGPVDNHTILGKTALSQSLTSLFTLALHGSSYPDDRYTSVVFELLRVAANICMDHDENRGRLLDAGFPQAIVSLLEGYAEAIPPPPQTQPLDLPVGHIKVIRTSIGALLNASIGYEPVKFRLISLEAPLTILTLSTAIYPTGLWFNGWTERGSQETAVEDTWAIRSGLSNWAWRAISELKDVKDETLQIFTPDFLPLLVSPLLAFLPNSPPVSRPVFNLQSTFASNLINADHEDLEESCMLIESLSLDVEDIRLSLARGLHFPAEHGGIPCLSIILDFIEYGTYPLSWRSPILDEAERKRKEKAFNICKAALIKSVVEVAGEESNEDVLWDDSEPDKPGGDFVYRMVNWLKRYVNDLDATNLDRATDSQSIFDREDMVICASLALGNLARREKNSTALVSSPYFLAPVLASSHLLSPSTDIKVKHGVIGLLKHLAQAPAHSYVIHSALGKAGVVRRIAGSGVWDEKADAMADIVQLSAIGVVKHMCSANVEHTFALVLPSSRSPSSPTGLAQVLALIKRSDSVAIKSEGSRVFVNVVKSLWSNGLPASPTADSSPIAAGAAFKEDLLERQRKRNAAVRAVLTPDCASTLASLVGRSGKYPLLVNEGVVALSLLSTQNEGGTLVLDALTIPLGLDSPISPTDPTSPPTTASDVSTPSSTTPSGQPRFNVPRHPLDMLIFILKNVDNPVNFPVEVRANVCSFFVQLGRHTSGEELEKVKPTVRPVLESLHAAQVKEDLLEKAIQRALGAWS